MRAEMAQHIERATERLRARGMSEREARAAAQREFGGIDQIEESARDARGGRWLETTLADARYALRQYRRTPVVTTTMLILLVLGIGANVALFTIVHSLLTQPPPGVARDDALVRIRGIERAGFTHGRLSYPEFVEYAKQTQIFSDVAAWTSASAVLDVGDVENGVIAGGVSYVTDNYFDVLRVRPVLGTTWPRGLALAAGAPPVGVISHNLWEQRFGGRSDIVGRTLELNGATLTIVGVAPPRFSGVDAYGPDFSVWVPLYARPVIESTTASAFASHDSTLFRVAARLAPGVTAENALPAVRVIAARAGTAMTKPQPQHSADIVGLTANNHQPRYSGDDDVIATVAAGVFTLLVLLITCTNVSTLLIGIAVTRRREIAVRLSLGAARARVIRQLLTETVVLALMAAVSAVLLTMWLMRVYVATAIDAQVVVAGPVLWFALALAIGTGMVFGLSPALHATRVTVSEVLKNTAPAVLSTRSLLQRGLVIAQIALTQPLLVGVGATMFIILAALKNEGAVPSDQIAVISFDMYSGNTNAQQRTSEMNALATQLAASPGVIGAVPLSAGHGIAEMVVHPSDRTNNAASHETLRIRMDRSPPGYFKLMGIPIVRGRDFEPSEYQPRYTSIIVGTDLARRLWGGAEPIGRRLMDPTDSSTLVVVGVVAEEQAGSSDVGNDLRIFTPSAGVLGTSLIYVRTHGPAAPVLRAIRQVARATAPNIPLRSAETLAAQEAENRRRLLRATTATAAGGLLALLLSAIGLYAVVAFTVSQRTREIGIRSALGANTGEIVNMFFLRGLRMSAIGLLIGLPLSLIALRIMSTQMGIRDVNVPLLAGGIAFFVLAVAAVATWIPARRAAGVDPFSAIRVD